MNSQTEHHCPKKHLRPLRQIFPATDQRLIRPAPRNSIDNGNRCSPGRRSPIRSDIGDTGCHGAREENSSEQITVYQLVRAVDRLAQSSQTGNQLETLTTVGRRRLELLDALCNPQWHSFPRCTIRGNKNINLGPRWDRRLRQESWALERRSRCMQPAGHRHHFVMARLRRAYDESVCPPA